jgi:hypothetical protein
MTQPFCVDGSVTEYFYTGLSTAVDKIKSVRNQHVREKKRVVRSCPVERGSLPEEPPICKTNLCCRYKILLDKFSMLWLLILFTSKITLII